MMGDDQSLSLSWPILAFMCIEIGFITVFALVAISTPKEATTTRVAGLFVLAGATYTMEGLITPLCLQNERPHWAAILTALLWVQLLNASDLLLLLGIDAYRRANSSSTMGFGSAMGLLFNFRRVGTPWQIKNLPSTTDIRAQRPTSFLIRRIAVTAAFYLFLDIMVSFPPPDPAMVRSDKVAISLQGLGVDDFIFRVGATVLFWFTPVLAVTATNNLFAIIAVLSGRSQPEDCPPAFGSFLEAYSVRRFWGISWHQLLRSSLTGHADLVMNTMFPFIPRQSIAGRHMRLTIAFAISGLIHWRADQRQGVPNAENGALAFFLLHAAAIILEDSARSVAALLPIPIRYIMGYFWVLSFFVWSTPLYMYPGIRLGFDAAGLLPIRFIGPYLGIIWASSLPNMRVQGLTNLD